MRPRRLLVMAVLIPASLAACGGGKEKPGGAKAAYIKQSDAVCADVIPKSKSLGNGRDQETAQKQADLWQDANTRLKALQAPQESIEQARQFVTDTENLSLGYTAAARALAANNGKANRYFSEVTDIRKRAADTAKSYGYEECVNIGDTSSQS